jgi:oxygen-independent coproporphyrinogen-3 oxidase
LREAGIQKINFDLMYGLPGQSVQSVRQTAMLAHALAPDRLAVFGYAHVPWMKPQQRLIGEAALPGPQERLAQAQAVHETLTDLGYQPIGLDHYACGGDELAVAACEGRLHRNFQGYTSDAGDALIGLGASAIGRLPQGYAQNAPDIAGYARAIGAGRFATVRGIALSADDRLRGRVIERLMCDMAVDLDLVTDEAGAPHDYFIDELQSLIGFEREGLVEIERRRVRVTDKGRPFLRVVAAEFDAYLATNRARHSVAV